VRGSFQRVFQSEKFNDEISNRESTFAAFESKITGRPAAAHPHRPNAVTSGILPEETAMHKLIFSLLSILCPALALSAEGDWYQFQGPSGNNHTTSDKLPLTWSETENVKWKTPIHGRGWSSPVIRDRQIWMGTASPDGHKMYAVCVDAESGEIVHDIHLFDVEEPREIHKLNSYASPTPIIEEGRVYMHFGSYGTACLDTKTGSVLWQRRDLPCNHWRGPGSSPIFYKNLLIVHYDGYDYQYVAALDRRTGETVWKTDRTPYIDYGTDDGDLMKAYCTPIVVNIEGRDQLISPTSKATVAYDPNSGQELWKVTYDEFSATAKPLYGDGMFFINTGFGKAKLYAVRAGGSGDVTESHVEWIQSKSIPSKPTPLLIDGLIYMIHDAGTAICVESTTGDIVWQSRVSGNYSASPLAAPGRIYLFDQEGKTTVIQTGREFKVLAENYLEKGFMASPAVYGDDLILRTETHLYRIGN
jgi:outer membrane protein assembly factor BamB